MDIEYLVKEGGDTEVNNCSKQGAISDALSPRNSVLGESLISPLQTWQGRVGAEYPGSI